MTPDVVVVGGGMITHDQILPSLYHMQRQGAVGEISVVAQHARTVRKLADAEIIKTAVPGQSFRAYPQSGDTPQPELYRDIIARLAPGNVVVAAVPDQLHFDVVMAARAAGQHVCCV